MRARRISVVAVIAYSLFIMSTAHASPGMLDELLREVKQSRAVESKLDVERETYFKAAGDQQTALLDRAKAEYLIQEERSKALKIRFDRNERELSELAVELNQRMGNLGEMFGVVRQVAGDARGILADSLVSIQYKDRLEFMNELVQGEELPSLVNLERLWYELQREMTESGKIVTFKANVIISDGKKSEQKVVRAGVFNIVSDGKFLRYLPAQDALVAFSRQPKSRFQRLARKFEESNPGDIRLMAVDPSRGAILSQIVQTPTIKERIQQGGVVGGVIILLGITGLLMVLERFIVLHKVDARIRQQLKNEVPDKNNPLGRVLALYHENTAADVETLELKLDDAILRETPTLERRLPAIKLLAAVAPLLGLLGTVIGMILTFQAITLFGTGDPKFMAGGISQALMTTVMGLVVAIPLLLFHSMLSAKSRRLVQVLEEESAGIIALTAEKRHGNV